MPGPNPHANGYKSGFGFPSLKYGSIKADIEGMNITIHRDDVSYGPYTMEQVKELIARGRIGYRDLACIHGQGKWQPVENLIIQDSFRRQREAYIEQMNSSPNPKKKSGGKGNGKGGKHANRWLWKPE